MIEFELDGEMRKILKKMVFGEIGYEQIEQ